MSERLIYQEKYVFDDGSIREMVIWQLPEKSPERPHGLKYRLYYGLPDGTCVVRYHNESGKGDHRHFENREEPYKFESVDKLVGDFLEEINRLRRR